MPGRTISAVIIFGCVISGGLAGYLFFHEIGAALWTTAGGGLLGFLSVLILRTWQRAPAQKLLGGAAGLLVGALFGFIVLRAVSFLIVSPELSLLIRCLFLGLCCLIGLQLGSAKASEFFEPLGITEKVADETLGILDTSVIIDGRISDVCETGFLTGRLIIPQFVLQELQMIADSSESTKRSRGRRGLDILNKMQKQSYITIIIDETDYKNIDEVDQKLIAMAKQTGYAILTNDFNLNKVAEVHSVQVLNINQLANALKPIVLPGETMRVHVLREGKEPGQGVAYLDDGTMVVVDNARRYVGKNVDATVTSVLQTTAGRMIFAVVKTTT
jgi:uncharacterized protein YacL